MLCRSKQCTLTGIRFPLSNSTRILALKDDENFFDDDNALDFILYQEASGQSQGNQNKPGKAGCLGVVALVVLPTAAIGYSILNIV